MSRIHSTRAFAEESLPPPTHSTRASTEVTLPRNASPTINPYSSSSSSTESTTLESATLPKSTHPMQTRSKSGIVKPRLNLVLLLTTAELTFVIQALASPEWKLAIQQEYDALMTN